MTIDVTGIDLVEFVKKVYELSVPLGMGFFHYTSEPLTDEEAKALIEKKGDIAVSLDYVKGRACKMTVFRKGKTLTIRDSWYDHTDKQFQELLDHVGIDASPQGKHGIACACPDCNND